MGTAVQPRPTTTSPCERAGAALDMRRALDAPRRAAMAQVGLRPHAQGGKHGRAGRGGVSNGRSESVGRGLERLRRRAAGGHQQRAGVAEQARDGVEGGHARGPHAAGQHRLPPEASACGEAGAVTTARLAP